MELPVTSMVPHTGINRNIRRIGVMYQKKRLLDAMPWAWQGKLKLRNRFRGKP